MKHSSQRQGLSCLRAPKSIRLSHWIAVYGSLAGIMVVWTGTAAIAQSAPPAPLPSPPVQKPDTPTASLPVAQKILGQWLTKEPLEGDTIMFVFAPEGKLFIISGTSASGNAIASQLQYRINDKPQPMHLDVVLAENAKVETLFEFTPSGDLRVQMLGTRPGKPRPNALAGNATVFQKISDDTTPPPGTDVKKPTTQPPSAPNTVQPPSAPQK